MLPRVRKLEQTFGEALVAIGVHAGKYTAERRTERIRRACLRLEVHHPVVNDRQFRIWRSYAVSAWPTLAFIDPKGYVVAAQAGELPLEALESFVAQLIEAHDGAGSLVRSPFPLAQPAAESPGLIDSSSLLRFPANVIAAGDRLYVSDTGNHRVLELSLPPRPDASPPSTGSRAVSSSANRGGARPIIVRAFGSGETGFADGPAERAAFSEPRGLALGPPLGPGAPSPSSHTPGAPTGTLYVADRANHAVRSIDLASGEVGTLAGTGELGNRIQPGPARRTALRSPWDLWLEGPMLFVAMAGSHQIWRLELATRELRAHAGSGGEAIDDGPLHRATLAQPSALAATGGRLYFADAESSAVRWADLRDDGRVGTLVGTGLFDFGDRDGTGDEVRLQHPQGLAAAGDGLVVADTYNDKLKRIDPAARTATTWPRPEADSPSLCEPGGLSVGNGYLYVADTGNHRIVRIRLADGSSEALEL